MKSTLSSWLYRTLPVQSPNRARQRLVSVAAAAGMAVALPGCLERPLGTDQPRTTNIIVDLLPQNVVSKVDMLFVIDNSMSMADKQAILAEAVPDLVGRFVKPVCVNAENQEAPYGGDGRCPDGYGPEFTPIEDIHIGVITSSLGGFGSQNDCVADPEKPYFVQKMDMAHLIGSLTDDFRRSEGAGDGGEFLTWNGGGTAEQSALQENFAKQVRAAGEQGCGWEATMEAWVHFLVDPAPFTAIVRQGCDGSPTSTACAGPQRDANGVPLVDNVILEQRRNFLRMDSLLAVIMLTDENDCSFKFNSQQWLVSDTFASENSGTFKGSAQCANDPNDPCCQSCGNTRINSGCPSVNTVVNEQTITVAQGCDPQTYPYATPGVAANSEDQGNLRCFKQKQRFGLDFLLPVERYANALNELQICPDRDSLVGCSNPVDNPVFTRDGTTRPKTLVFFGGIVGVPWQDLAINVADPILRYRKANSENPDEIIPWDKLLGARVNGERVLYPTNDGTIDPLMYESVEPRAGLPGPDAPYMANPSNGHEWNILDRSDLQYACIFPKPTTTCPTQAEVDAMLDANPAEPIANCDCTYYGPGTSEDGEYNSPLCQQPDGDYGLAQSFGKAYPGVRELQALELFAEKNPTKNSIVASICPKEAGNTDADRQKKDWGYRPAVATIVDRLKEQLQEPCLPRPLATKEDGGAACIIIEATTDATGCEISVENARSEVDPAIKPLVYQALQTKELCTGSQCDAYKLCEIPQVLPTDGGYEACIAGREGANGWCYVDEASLTPAQLENPEIEAALAKCPDTAKRKLRFAGEGKADTASSLTFYACSGSVYDVNEEM